MWPQRKAAPVAPKSLLSAAVLGVAQGMLDSGLATRDDLRAYKAHDVAKAALTELRSWNLKTLVAELRVLWQVGPAKYVEQVKRGL